MGGGGGGGDRPSDRVQTILGNYAEFPEDNIMCLILQAKKFLKCDWLGPVVFEPNLKYLHVKNYSFHGDLND